MDTPDPFAALWIEYWGDQSTTARNALIEAYLPYVQRIAGTYDKHLGHRNILERDDLVNSGVFGLVDAIERFNPAHGVAFTSYASTRVRGAMTDEIRSMDWTPRSLRRKSKSLEAQVDLARIAGYEASEVQLAEALHISTDALSSLRGELAHSYIRSMDNNVHDTHDDDQTAYDVTVDASLGPEAIAEAEDMLTVLARCVESLPVKQQRLLADYYWAGMTLSDIGTAAGVTESWMCQVRGKAQRTLKHRLTQEWAA